MSEILIKKNIKVTDRYRPLLLFQIFHSMITKMAKTKQRPLMSLMLVVAMATAAEAKLDTNAESTALMPWEEEDDFDD